MKFIKAIIFIAVSLLMVTACDDFGDMNKNPNAPTSIENNPELLVTYLTKNLPTMMAEQFWGDGGGLQGQYQAKIVFTEYDLFNWGSNSGLWNNMYTYTRNCNNLTEIGHEGYQAVAATLKGYMFHMLVDHYNDVPYSEALKGKTEQNYTPKYDTGEFIYTDVLAQLEKANDMYAANTSAITGDVLNDNDLTIWRKFNNSLMLRMYMRMSEVKPTEAAAGFAKVINDPAKYPILDNSSENISLTFLPSRPNTYPIHTYRVGSFDEIRLAETFESILKSYDDPRMELWFRPTASSVDAGTPEWEGMRNGLADGVAYIYKGGSLNLSRVGSMFYESPNAAEGILMLQSEVEFLIAEAIQRGWVSGNQQQHYENGIQASFEYWNSRAQVNDQALEIPADYTTRQSVPKTEYNTDFDVPVAYDGSLEQIIIQKYIANFMVGIEGFSDYRRTGFPDLIKPGPDAQWDEYPNRYLYPGEEQSLNGASRAEAVSRLQPYGDDNRSKIWWQK
jgi:hypothetical protein